MKDFTGSTYKQTLANGTKGALDMTENTLGTLIESVVLNSWMTELANVILTAGGTINPAPDDGLSLFRAINDQIADLTLGDRFLGETRTYAGTGALPNGWLECDGGVVPVGATYNAFRAWIDTNATYLKVGGIYYTPNHIGLVSVGSGVEGAIDMSVGEKGGEFRVSLELNEIPGHRHTCPTVSDLGGTGTLGLDLRQEDDATDLYTGYTGGGTEGLPSTAISHENMQPYIVERKMIRAYL